jgi:hypothetical protein
MLGFRSIIETPRMLEERSAVEQMDQAVSLVVHTGESAGTLHPHAHRAGFSSHHGSTSRHFTSRQLRLPASEAALHSKTAARDA